MSASFQLGGDCAELGTHAFTDGVPKEQEASFPGSSADVREAQKVEGLRLSFRPSLPFGRCEASKLDEPGLIAVQFQAELAHPLMQESQELLRFLAMLKAHHKIIGIPYQENVSFGVMPAPVMCPRV